jgi:polyisoprenyl-teichoic acid--peptidoglycan teichoic acid transferase
MMSAPLSFRAFAHRFLVALVVGAVLTGALVVGANVVEAIKISHIRKAPIDPSLLTEGGNYLIIGSDSRAFVDTQKDAQHFGTKDSQSGQRSDTIMIAHIDPGKHTGILVSLPRDLWVAIPGHGTAKINAAFAFGGPQLTIATIKQDFDIPISHYLEVDFAGFRDIVNAIGSVPIFFPTPARDKNTGLDVAAGCQHLTGEQALAYVRSRYYQYQTADGQWHYDPTSDIGRIHRQQYFMRSLARAAIKTVFPDPLKFNDVLDKTVASLTSDRNFGGSDLRALVRALRNTDPKAFPMYTLPATNAFRDSQSVLLLDDAQAAPTLARLRNAQKKPAPVPKISPATVRVTVENGSGVSGAAGKARGDLGRDGFALAGPAANADRSDYNVTEVRYGPGAKSKAELVLAYLSGAGKVVALGTRPSGADVIVVLGSDFQQVTAPSTSTTAAPKATGGPSTTTSTIAPANPGGAVPEAGC